jgi:hypothetical protein
MERELMLLLTSTEHAQQLVQTRDARPRGIGLRDVLVTIPYTRWRHASRHGWRLHHITSHELLQPGSPARHFVVLLLSANSGI